MKNFLLAILLFIATTQSTNATNYYVSVENGTNTADGTENSPFKTIQSAIEVMQPGDTCFIMEGRYHEEIVTSKLEGTEDAPFIFTNYQDQSAVLDGTSPISTQWSLHENNIYKTTLSEDIWQLFVEDKMMTSARWPNANAWSMDMWDKENTWGHQEESSTDGNFIDDGQRDLAGTGIDFTGSIAIMNTGSWLSFARKVNTHGAGSNSFTYDEIGSEYHHKTQNGSYFFEASYACLDVENEWYYDATTKELFFIPPNGTDPNELSIHGKTDTYAFDIDNSSQIKMIGLNFFATTINFTNSTYLTIKDCNFDYPSYSKRMLGEIETAAPTTIAASKYNDSYNTVKNCRFEKADGTGLFMTGKNDLIENCYFHDIDYSCVGELNDNVLNIRDANYLTLKYTTIDWGGNSLGIKVGKSSEVAYCEVSNIGFLQHDGAAIQASENDVDGINLHHNWVHDCIKFALRFDSPWNDGDTYGINGIMAYNVFWNAKPIIPKGDHHFIYNNTGFNNEGFDIGIYSDETHGGFNYSTETRNNLVFAISGSNSKTITPYNGIDENNWIGNDLSPTLEVSSQLNDPENLDFRPKTNSALIDAGYYKEGITTDFTGVSPDIGAYEADPSSYWVPGFKFTKTSNPIPVNGGMSKSDHIRLMWRKAHGANSYDIYISPDSLTTADANTSDESYIGATSTNKVSPGKISSGQKYYWRVDARQGDNVIAGDVWQFTASVSANISEGSHENITWTGTTNNDWLTTSNWDGGIVPGNTDYVFISSSENKPVITSDVVINSLNIADNMDLTVTSDYSLTIDGELSADLGHLIIEANASLITNGMVSGTNHVFKHDNSVAQSHMIGSPVSQAVAGDINSTLLRYDETIPYNSFIDNGSGGNDGADRWITLGANDKLQAGLGYSTDKTESNTFQGTPNTGDLVIPISYTDHDVSGANYEEYFEGMNLVSNPYPTAISVYSFMIANSLAIESPVWVWNEDIEDYITMNPLGQVGDTNDESAWQFGIINPFQGYFIKAKPSIDELKFNKDMRLITSSADQHSLDTDTKNFQTIRLSLTGKGIANETLIGVVEEASLGQDKYDAQKLIINEGMKLFSYAEERALAIQGLPAIDSSISISLGITITEASEYVLDITELKNWASEPPIFLVDNILKTYHDLSTDGAYTFDSDAVSNQNRFNLSFVEPLLLNINSEADLHGLQVVHQKEGVQIDCRSTSNHLISMEIVNLAGKTLFSRHYKNDTIKEFIPFNFETRQVFIIRVVSKKGVYTNKIMFY
ncbi:MAG: DUF1565 domain-containing protein [Reichenbachiella sp.]